VTLAVGLSSLDTGAAFGFAVVASLVVSGGAFAVRAQLAAAPAR